MLINAVMEKDENGYFAFVPYSKRLCIAREKSQGKSYEEALRNLEVLEADELAFLGRKAAIEFI
ncbi:hypothetical protein [Helicobacter pylori]|uniref:hypothetical protein n=1 Tax=Helicobacter pylori TaxID=210 RepID=UPI00041B00F7|nr:hypothetical protein [Helicobacter pylori]